MFLLHTGVQSHFKRIVLSFVSLLILLVSSQGWAQCTMNRSPQYLETDDWSAAKIRFGNVQLMNQAIQPLGSVIASTVVAPTEFRARNANSESILWTCDEGDQNYITFLVSTNGDDFYGGRTEVAATDAGGQSGVFYTAAQLLGLRLTMAGKVVTQYYQDIPVNYETGSGANGCAVGKICIRLKHIPNLQAELIRIQTNPETNTGVVKPWLSSGIYSYLGPAAYIQLSNKTNGIGPQPVTFGHDEIGESHTTNFAFWGADNGIGYTLYNAVSMSPPSNSCLTTFTTPVVNFPKTNTQALNDGGEVSADFEVQVQCHNSAQRGISSGQGAFNSLRNVGSTIAVETSALGAANTGDIYLEQGSLSAGSSGAESASMAAARGATRSSGWGWYSNSSSYGSAFNSAYGSNFENSLDETLSNYSAANIAYNSGSIDASVNTAGLVNRINGISTSAVGAVNTGGISVVVK